jgi:hypothetical protein
VILSNAAEDMASDFYLPVHPLIASGPGGFIAGWTTPYNSGFKRVKLQRFLLDGTLDPTWPAGALEAVAVDSISGVTLLPDGLGGVHVLWYSMTQNAFLGTHVLAGGQFAPGLGPHGVALPAPGSQPLLPRYMIYTRLAYVTADAAPDGGLVFAWNDDALAPTLSIRVRWLRSDYTANPSEPAEGRLILPSGPGTELRGVHADGVGGAFVAWEVFDPFVYERVGQIWMTRLLPSSLVGVPPVARGGSFALSAPHPNPSRGVIAFDVTLPDDSPARVELLDVAGRVQRTQVVQGPGNHSVTFDGAGSLAPGLYFARATSRTGTRNVRVVVAR